MATTMFLIFLAFNLVFWNAFSCLAVANNGQCVSNSDCASSNRSNSTKVCCGGYPNITRSGNFNITRGCSNNTCIGFNCSSDGDCGGLGECCLANQCVTTGWLSIKSTL